MGQTSSIAEDLPGALSNVHFQFVKHSKVLMELNSLSHKDFEEELKSLNELSRHCVDSNGKQLVFLVKKGSDTSPLFWKATVRIACIKVDTSTKKIESYKLINLKQFIAVYNTFHSYLENIKVCETQRNNSQQTDSSESSPMNGSVLMREFNDLLSKQASEDRTECSICLDRMTEVILPCTHSFCSPCIEQWNVNKKTCPICSECLESTDDTWVYTDMPGMCEINDQICSEIINLSNSN